MATPDNAAFVWERELSPLIPVQDLEDIAQTHSYPKGASEYLHVEPPWFIHRYQHGHTRTHTHRSKTKTVDIGLSGATLLSFIIAHQGSQKQTVYTLVHSLSF